MATTSQPEKGSHRQSSGSLTFFINPNFGLSAEEEPLKELLPTLGITARLATELPSVKQALADGVPDYAYVSISDFLRSVAQGNRHYQGFAIATSKFTGTTNLPSVLVVRRNDPARSFADLAGARYGYINKSCSSSYFPPAIVLGRQGKRLDEYLDILQVKAWQGQIDAVVAGEVRATMVAEDIWKTTPKNADDTKIIGRYDNGKPAVIVARQGLDEETGKQLLSALVARMPEWEEPFGAFRPYYYADVQAYYHDLKEVPASL